MRTRNEILFSIFRQGGVGYFESGDTLVEAGELPRYVYQLRTGLAYQSCWFPDGRRAIVNIFAPGNVVGLEMMLSLRASGTVTAAGPVKCFAFGGGPPTFRGACGSDCPPRSTRARRCHANRPLRQTAATQIDRALDIQPLSDAAADW